MAYSNSNDRYNGGRYGEKKSYSGKKSFGDGDKRSYGEKKPYGEKRAYGEKKSYGDKPYGEKSYGERKSYADKKYSRREDRDRFEENKSFSAKKAYEERDVKKSPEQEQDELPFLLFGRNSVREAIKSGRGIDKILVTKDQDGSLREILEAARERKLVIREVDRKKLDEVCMPFGHGGKTANHQGICAYTPGVEYCEVEDMLKLAKEKGEDPFIILLDGIEDPHNLGSIIRSAECAGAHGVIIGKRRSASLTAAAVKSSAGAAEYMPIAKVVNLGAALDSLKKAGLWAAGADMGGKAMYSLPLTGPLVLVIGSEGEGISRLIKEKCDFIVSIPMGGHIDSLNAGVAAGILMFEKRRQESAKRKVAAETEA